MTFKLCLIPLVLMSAAMAETVPVTATIKETRQVVKGAQVVESSVRDGALYRGSDGSTLRQFKDRGQLSTPLKSYAIDYANRKVMEMPRDQGVEDYRGMKSLGENTVAGIRCKLIAVEAQGPTDTKAQKVGTACVSAEYGLMLRQETSYRRKDGMIVHVVMELSNVQLHSEPEARVFEVPKDFEQGQR